MCGIAGLICLKGFDPQLLMSMTHLVKHRGPDGYGFAYFRARQDTPGEVILNQDRLPSLEQPQIGFGHRRLAIIDLSPLGLQPMQTGDGNLSIIFNGEVYNYLELRRELEVLGYTFRTRTDTEVILRAYQAWGSECLKRFNGMWSFALWDRSRQRLFCARDRFGVKPFYYYAEKTCFVFASELKQILQLPFVKRSLNHELVFDFLNLRLLDHTAETFCRGIHQLPGGHFLTVDVSKQETDPVIKPFWDLPVGPEDGLSDDEAAEEFLAKFRKAVTLRMRSDVPVGSCLSGGMDSSSIVCLAKSLVRNENFHTFSACFEEKALDERRYVQEVVAATGVKSHLVFPTGKQLEETLERMLWHQDEPIASSSPFAQWSVMEEARRENIPVLLDGQGGDETLCGYRKFFYFHLWHLLRRAKPSFATEAVLSVFRGGASSPWHWADVRRYLPGILKRSASLPARVCKREFEQKYQGRGVDVGPGASLSERQKSDLVKFSLPVLLRYEDRNSMAHSIETRLPFLDYEFAEFLVNQRGNLKFRHGWSKWILRQTMRGNLPEKVRLRKDKMGFGTPETRWVCENLHDRIAEVFNASQFAMEGVLDAQKVRNELSKFSSGQPDCLPASAIFQIFTLESWARMFKIS